MATEITSAVTLTPSLAGNIQSSYANGSIAPAISAPGVLHSLAITSGISLGIVHDWTAHAEQYRYDPGLALNIPALTFQGEGQDGASGTLSLLFPSLLFAGVASDGALGRLSVSLPRMSADITALVNEKGQLVLTFPSLQFLGAAERGAVGTLTLTLPSLAWAATSYLSAEGTLAVIIPMLGLQAAMLPTTYLSMVLNIRNNALTLYENYNFNSFCRFNGKNYGATAAGIFDLDSGTMDDEALIDWNFRTSYLDLHQKIKKGLKQAWFSYKSDGNIIVTVVQPDGAEYEYPLEGVEVTEDGVRVKFGKGIRSKYVALDVRSVDGSTITLDALKLHFEKMTKER